MRIGPFGIWELLIILLVLLLLFGASRLPALARSIGQSVTELRRGFREGEEVEKEVNEKRDVPPKGEGARTEGPIERSRPSV